MGVAVGEAGGIAPSYSLISDYFPRERRSRALAFFSLGIPIGSALGVFFGGWLAAHLSWRSAFVIVGLLGLPAALLIKLLIPEPERGRFDAAAPRRLRRRAGRRASADAHAELLAAVVWRGVGIDPRLRPDLLAPELLQPQLRSRAVEDRLVLWVDRAGRRCSGNVARRLARRPCWSEPPGAYALIPAVCFLIAAPVFALGLFAPNLWIGWVLFTIGQMLALAWLGPVITAVQHIVLPSMRATASASFLFINNLIGIAFGIYFFGWFSDAMKAAHGEDLLKFSILYGLVFYLFAALFYLFAAQRLRADIRS